MADVSRKMFIVKGFLIALELLLCVGAIVVIALAAAGEFQKDNTSLIPTVMPPQSRALERGSQ